MVPGPLTLAYFSHSSIAFCDTAVTSNNQHTEHVTIVCCFFLGGGGGGGTHAHIVDWSEAL